VKGALVTVLCGHSGVRGTAYPIYRNLEKYFVPNILWN
jgi:hypothetical protein